MNAVFVATAFVLLTNVWRWHDLLLPSALQPVLIAMVVGGFVLVFDRCATHVIGDAARRPMARALLGLLIVAALSVPTSLYPNHSLQFLLLSIIPALVGLLLVVVATQSTRAAERLMGVQVLGCTLFAFMALTRFEVGAEGRWMELVFYDANDLGLLIVSTLPMAVYGLWRGGTFRRLTMVAAASILFLALAQTGSRGAFFGLIAALGTMLLFMRVVGPGRRLALATVGAVAFLVLAPATYKESLVALVTPSSDYNWSGETGRLELWQRGMGYMVDRPMLGVGLDAFPVAEGRISALADRQGYGVGLKWSAAHNSFVQAGAELGVLGLLFFAGMLYLAFDSCRRVAIWARGRDAQLAAMAQVLAASLAGFVVSGLFLSQAYAAFLFALLGQILGLQLLVARRMRAT
jgi:O-antigen ligase